VTEFLAVTSVSSAILIGLTVLGVYGIAALFAKGNTNHPHPHIPNWTPLEAVGITIAIYALSQVLVTLVLLTYLAATGQSMDGAAEVLESSVWVQFGYVVLVEAYTVLVIWWFLRRRRNVWSSIGMVRPRLRDVWYAVLGFGGYFVAYVVLAQVVQVSLPQLDLDQKQELGFSTEARGLALLPIFVSLVILPPLVEEILTRGVLYSGLRRRLSMVGAGIITSILFAAAHLQAGSGNTLLWIAALDTFVLSMMLVYLREKTGSLWPGIGLHALKNFIAFMALFVFHAA
jgi:hypothetical protein